jgi:hypothetical protein
MATKGGRRGVLGVAIVGFGILTMLTSIIFGAPSLAGIGLAAFLIGLLTLYLPSQPSVTPEMVEAYALPSLENVERFLRELASDSKATYLALKDRSDQLKVFIPLDDNPASYPPEQPDYDQLITVNPNDPHRTGLLLDAPGASLLTLMEKESGLNFFDITRANLQDALRTTLVESLELVADVKCSFSDSQMTLRIREGDVKIGQMVVKSAPKTAARLGCPTCSAAICATVKAAKRHVVVENASHEGKDHGLTLTFVGRTEDAGY